MSKVRSFAPVAGRGAAALILGSMPGRASLEAGEYYAHPRNLFWPIIAGTFGGVFPSSYPARLRLLKANRTALWDVLRSCVRPGSADSDIEKSSIRPNDLAAFFRRHPGIKRVFFNGAKAEECYKKYVLPSLPPAFAGLTYRRLPSTSPAHAALSRARKAALWKAALTRPVEPA